MGRLFLSPGLPLSPHERREVHDRLDLPASDMEKLRPGNAERLLGLRMAA
jgi:hypothetical protein